MFKIEVKRNQMNAAAIHISSRSRAHMLPIERDSCLSGIRDNRNHGAQAPMIEIDSDLPFPRARAPS
jgi:hypothetical protein